ncbi:hypothetical protein MRX96_051977 [Rhipicephalus microplus]
MNVLPANSQETFSEKSTHFVKKRSDTFILGAVLVFGLLFVILVVMQLIFRRRGEKLVGMSDFCCVDEARLLLDDLNTSVDPCGSFYDFVCLKGPHVGDSSRKSPGLRSLEIEWALVENPTGRGQHVHRHHTVASGAQLRHARLEAPASVARVHQGCRCRRQPLSLRNASSKPHEHLPVYGPDGVQVQRTSSFVFYQR